MRLNGTICRPAVDTCDQPERWVMLVYISNYTVDLDFIDSQASLNREEAPFCIHILMKKAFRRVLDSSLHTIVVIKQ